MRSSHARRPPAVFVLCAHRVTSTEVSDRRNEPQPGGRASGRGCFGGLGNVTQPRDWCRQEPRSLRTATRWLVLKGRCLLLLRNENGCLRSRARLTARSSSPRSCVPDTSTLLVSCTKLKLRTNWLFTTGWSVVLRTVTSSSQGKKGGDLFVGHVARDGRLLRCQAHNELLDDRKLFDRRDRSAQNERNGQSLLQNRHSTAGWPETWNHSHRPPQSRRRQFPGQ